MTWLALYIFDVTQR